MHSLWWALAWLEIKQRYRRSVIGPFWLTISTGVMVAAMGPLYGALLGQDVASYIQYLSVSLVIWAFIASSINEAGSAFVGSEGYIKQIALPLSVYVLKLLSRNLLILAHNVVIVVVLLCILPPKRWDLFWLVPLGLMLVLANLFWLVLFLGLLSTRFRDIPQLVGNLVQVAFFLSPILWKADMLSPQKRYLIELNPIYHFMEVIRAPLLGEPFGALSWIVCASLLLLGGGMTFLMFSRVRNRVPFWL